MTGIRSWTAEVTAFGVVVKIEHVSGVLPGASFHRSQSPANANNSASLISKQKGCFDFPMRRHSQNPLAGTMHRRDFNASRKAGSVAGVSDLALIILAAPDASLAHQGMSPQRTSDNSRRGSFGCWRMIGTG